MYLYLYKNNPTDSGTDGSPASEGTGLNPITTNALTFGNNEVSSVITLAIRCEDGYSTSGDTTITPTGATADMWALSADNITWGEYGASLTISTVIGVVNTLVYCKAKSESDESVINDIDVDLKIIGIAASIDPDTLVTVYTDILNLFDTRRILASSLQYKSLNMTIAAKTLTDTFTMQTYESSEIDETTTGTIKNFDFTFKASEISSDGYLNTIVGKYDIDDVLNQGMYSLFDDTGMDFDNVKAKRTMQILVARLGKTINISITDFSPAEFETNPTGKELISALFGWTDKIPMYQVNVFIRGDVINVIERGKETETVEVLNYANYTVKRKKIRTLQDSQDVAGTEITRTLAGQAPQETTSYLSGTFENGDTSITYSSGLVVEEKHTVNGVEETTAYTYSSSYPPAYLLLKSTTTETERVDVAYEYDSEKLCTETESHYEDDELTSERITRHYPIGQGMWGTSVEEDDVTTYGGISQGAPGGKASGYSIAKNSVTTTKTIPTYTMPGKVYDKYMGTLPVTDSTTVTRVANAIIWLDKKTEYRVTLDAYADDIFDLSKTITWCGNVYYLESNSITVDPDKTVQKLEMVRWA